MPTQLDIKRRIRSVKNTQQITRAMKFVAAARLRRAQEKAVSARPYTRALSRVVHSAAMRTPETVHPLLRRRPEERVLLLTVSGERGLAGAFNSNIIRRAIEFLREQPARKLEVISLGRKMRDAMRKQRWEIIGEYVDITTRAEPARAAEIAHKLAELYIAEEVDAIYIVFNEFKSVLTQNLTLQKLLPIEPDPALAGEGAELAGGRNGGRLSLRAASGRALWAPTTAIPGIAIIPRVGRVGSFRARRAHDRNGFGYQQCGRPN